MGRKQHTSEAGSAARGRRLGWRVCLRKGCGRRYQARQWNQRYCQDPECLRLVHRWQATKRQRQRRAAPEERQKHAEAERSRRQRDPVGSRSPPEEERKYVTRKTKAGRLKRRLEYKATADKRLVLPSAPPSSTGSGQIVANNRSRRIAVGGYVQGDESGLSLPRSQGSEAAVVRAREELLAEDRK